MITIDTVDVFCDYGNQLNRVSWDFHPTTQHLSNFQIEVQKALSPSESFTTIGIAPSDIYSLNDSDIYPLDRSKKYYYQLKVTDKTTSDIIYSEPAFSTYVVSPLAAEVVRREALLLTLYIANPVKIFIRKTEGQKCTSCWDAVKQRITTSHCSSCWGTGFQGGYYNYISGYMGTTPKTHQIRWQYGIELTETDLMRWTSNYPPLTPDDLIVDVRSNDRYKVSRVELTRLENYPLKQTVMLHQIKVGEIEYSIPLT